MTTGLSGPFDLAFIDALKPEYGAYLDALTAGRLAPDALVLADNVLWSGRVSGATPVGGEPSTEALRAFSQRYSRTIASRRRSCPSATAARRDVARVTDAAVVRIRVRLFAIQRELAGTREVPLDLPDGATVADAWRGLVALHARTGSGLGPVRPQRRLRRRIDSAQRRRRGGHDPARVRR